MQNISRGHDVVAMRRGRSNWLLGPFSDPDLRNPAITGLVAATVTVLIGSLIRPTSGRRFSWPLAFMHNGGVPKFVVMGTSAVAVATLVYAWWMIVRVVRVRAVPIVESVSLMLWWSLPFALGPALFSRDIYSYAAQGEMVARGLNPSTDGPAALNLLGTGHNVFTQLSDPIWRHTAAPYGPLWFRLSGTIVSVSGHRPELANFMFRLVAFGSVAVIAWAMVHLARRYDVEPSRVLVLGVLNPLVLMHLISGAHNEGLMMALLLLGLVWAGDGHRIVGIVLIALAAAVKIPALAGVVIVGWGWFGSDAPFRRRVWGVVIAMGLGSVALGVTSIATGLGFAWIHTFGAPGQVRALGAPVASFALVVEQITRLLGVDWSRSAITSLVRLGGLGLAAVISGAIVYRSRERVSIVSLGVLLLVVDLLGPALYPWYLLAPFALLAYGRRPWKETAIVALTVVSAMLIKPSGAGVLYEIGPFGPWVMPVIAAAGLVWWVRTHGGLDPGANDPTSPNGSAPMSAAPNEPGSRRFAG